MLAGVVCLVMLYVGVRELTQPGWVYGRGVASEITSRLTPAAGPAKLMSVDDMRRLVDEN